MVRGLATRTPKRGKKSTPDTSTTSKVSEIEGFSKMTQPKLQLFGIASRYANALYSVAAKDNKLDNVEKELLQIQQLVQTNENFQAFLKDPTIPRHQKKKDIDNMMKDAKFSQPVAGLFSILAANGRLPQAAQVIETYQKLMGAYRGEVQACVVSADPLTATQLKQVEKALGTHIGKTDQLLLETKVDPTILGGLKVHIGTMFIDLSLATKINKIQTILSKPVN